MSAHHTLSLQNMMNSTVQGTVQCWIQYIQHGDAAPACLTRSSASTSSTEAAARHHSTDKLCCSLSTYEPCVTHGAHAHAHRTYAHAHAHGSHAYTCVWCCCHFLTCYRTLDDNHCIFGCIHGHGQMLQGDFHDGALQQLIKYAGVVICTCTHSLSNVHVTPNKCADVPC